MRLNHFTTIAMVLAFVAAVSVPVVARAEQIGGTDQPGERLTKAQRQLEEVVVYGTKRARAELAQEVPGQVAAFSEDTLEARHVVTLEDLSFATGNVTLDAIGTQPGTANFMIRGLGINSSLPSIDPTVGVFVDGVYLGVIFGTVVDTFDLEAVEIHKGPQGVLFGRNVTGGAVMMRTRRPSHDFQVRAKATLETGLETRLSSTIQGSLIPDVLAGKIGIQWKDDNGYFDNDFLGRDVGKQETLVVRPALTYTPIPTLDITAIFEHGSSDGDGTVAQDPQGAPASRPSTDVVVNQNMPGELDLEWSQLTLEGNWDVGPGTVTGIFGYREVDLFSTGDVDAVSQDLFAVSFFLDQEQSSFELRYNAEITPWWEPTFGVYYFEQEFEYVEQRDVFGGLLQLAGGGNQDHDTWGVFVNNQFRLSDRVSVTAGLRYTSEEKDAEIFRFGGVCEFANLQEGLTCPAGAGAPGDGSWSNLTPKLGVQWQVQPNANLYAHWARAYRSGGFNFRTPFADPSPTDEEEQDSFEVGIKSSWLDGRLMLNGALFYNNLSDLQRETNVADPDFGNIQDVRNVADARILGGELDLTALVTEEFALSLSVGHLDGEYKEVLSDLTGDGIVSDADKNLEIARLVPWTVAVGATYDFRLGDLGWLTARADYSFRDRAYFDDGNVTRFRSYDMLDLSLALTPPDERWTVVVYGRNLFDEAVLGVGSPTPFGDFGGNYFGTMAKGERFGVEFSLEL